VEGLGRGFDAPMKNMKAAAKIALLLIGSLIGFLAIGYAISCRNTGGTISLGHFFDGLVGRTSNCGGNPAAKNVCFELYLIALVEAQTNGGKANFSKLSPYWTGCAHKTISSGWTIGAKYLLYREDFVCNTNNDKIIAICDAAYGNVPQPNFWNFHKQTPHHAVSLANGTTKFITPEEYEKLDKTAFVEAAKLLPSPPPDNFDSKHPFE
jgi:hypothetical protein